MMESIKSMLGINSPDFKQLVEEGAKIVDVRSPQEFMSGHVAGAVNIPLDKLEQNLNKVGSKNQTIITCCASGMRSSAAVGFLKSKGYETVYNGGGWMRLQGRINE